MSNNNFSEHFSKYANKFTQVEWQEWLETFQEQNSQNLAHLQNIVNSNAQNLGKNTQLLLDTMKNNVSASNLEEAMANQYNLLKDVAENNVENFKEVLSNVSVNAINNYSNVANNFLDQLQKHADLNNAPK
jgi:hypothetical protein